jgi:alcohol dehydrogenase
VEAAPRAQNRANPEWRYANPVRIVFGWGTLARIGELVGARRYALVSYGEPVLAEPAARLPALAGPPVAVIDQVVPNPNFAALEEACQRCGAARPRPEVLVALGGGSVIDTAKVLAAADGDFARVRRYLETGEGAEALDALPIIALPSTAGTGSEVTPWATVWDTQASKKHSLSLPALYPEHAVVDPALTLGAPRELTVSTGLDALSHALESVWNVNANPVSAQFAICAAREVLAVLPVLVGELGNRELRERMARAALFAGLAFSNTKTALAHSLSYPITLRHGVPHGIACSFSLPVVMRLAMGTDTECDATLQAVFGPDLTAGADRLETWLVELGVSVDPEDYGLGADEWPRTVAAALEGERGQNLIAQADAHPDGARQTGPSGDGARRS